MTKKIDFEWSERFCVAVRQTPSKETWTTNNAPRKELQRQSNPLELSEMIAKDTNCSQIEARKLSSQRKLGFSRFNSIYFRSMLYLYANAIYPCKISQKWYPKSPPAIIMH